MEICKNYVLICNDNLVFIKFETYYDWIHY